MIPLWIGCCSSAGRRWAGRQAASTRCTLFIPKPRAQIPLPIAMIFAICAFLADGTVELTEQGSPARFAEEWQRLFLTACRLPHPLRPSHLRFRWRKAAHGGSPYHLRQAAALRQCRGGICPCRRVAGRYPHFLGYRWVRRFCEDDMFRAVGALSVLDGIAEVEKAVGSELPGHCRPVAYLLHGTVTLYDRKNKKYPASA